MGEAKRREEAQRADPVRQAALYMLSERAKRNILAKCERDGIDPSTVNVVIDRMPPEENIRVAEADVRSVALFFGISVGEGEVMN